MQKLENLKLKSVFTVGARFRVTCDIAARNAIKVNASPRNSTEFVCSSTSTSSLPNLWNLDSANIFVIYLMVNV